MDPISAEKISMLDLLLVQAAEIGQVLSVCSDRFATLATHHFTILVVLNIQFERPCQVSARKKRLDLAALAAPPVSGKVCQNFHHLVEAHEGGSIGCRWRSMCSSMNEALENHVPTIPQTRRKPWISESTLTVIDERQQTRLTHDRVSELRLQK